MSYFSPALHINWSLIIFPFGNVSSGTYSGLYERGNMNFFFGGRHDPNVPVQLWSNWQRHPRVAIRLFVSTRRHKGIDVVSLWHHTTKRVVDKSLGVIRLLPVSKSSRWGWNVISNSLAKFCSVSTVKDFAKTLASFMPMMRKNWCSVVDMAQFEWKDEFEESPKLQ